MFHKIIIYKAILIMTSLSPITGVIAYHPIVRLGILWLYHYWTDLSFLPYDYRYISRGANDDCTTEYDLSLKQESF